MTRNRRLAAGLAILAGGAAVALLASVDPTPAHDGQSEGSESRIQRGLESAPVTLNMHGKNRALVALGSYFVNALGACNDCHTCPSYAPGHNPFDGVGDGAINGTNYLAGGVPFGPFTSRNLTPDANGLPAGMTRAEFIQTIRTGHSPNSGGATLQVMPWPILRNLNNRDLKAIYEYLSALPHAEPGTCDSPGQ